MPGYGVCPGAVSVAVTSTLSVSGRRSGSRVSCHPSTFAAVADEPEAKASPFLLGTDMNKSLISAVSLLALTVGMAKAQDATAQDDVTVLENITVVANRTPTEAGKVGSKVDRITEADIEARSLPSVVEHLARLP